MAEVPASFTLGLDPDVIAPARRCRVHDQDRTDLPDT